MTQRLRSVGLALLLGAGAGGVAEAEPSWYPNRFDLLDALVAVDREAGLLTIGEATVVLDPRARIRTPEGEAGLDHLRRGMLLGIARHVPGESVGEVWVMPEAPQ